MGGLINKWKFPAKIARKRHFPRPVRAFSVGFGAYEISPSLFQGGTSGSSTDFRRYRDTSDKFDMGDEHFFPLLRKPKPTSTKIAAARAPKR